MKDIDKLDLIITFLFMNMMGLLLSAGYFLGVPDDTGFNYVVVFFFFIVFIGHTFFFDKFLNERIVAN